MLCKEEGGRKKRTGKEEKGKKKGCLEATSFCVPTDLFSVQQRPTVSSVFDREAQPQ